MAARNSNFCYLLNALYPVGSIYVSKDPTDPAELFGGSWKRIKERFIWAIGDNENPGDTGGEKTHTLTEAELPELSGSIYNFALQSNDVSVGTSGVFSTRSGAQWATYGTNGDTTNSDIVDFSAGSEQAHNNMPPWEGFYIWERIESDVPMGGSAGMLLADQTYNPESANAQSGIAVAQAVDTCSPAIVTASDTGKALTVNDSSESALKGLTAYGESTQDGTPTPDSPVEIVSVENPVISIYGKNLIPYPYEETTKTINGITFTDNGDGTVTANGTATAAAYFRLQSTKPINVENQTVVLSGCPVGGSTSSYFILLSYGGNSYQDIGSGLTRTPTEPVTIQLRVASGATVNNITFKPQLELGSVATAYEPNSRLQTVTVPYTFRGLKNTATEQWSARDELRVGNGKVETKTSFKKMIFNGTENWSAYTSQSNHFQITVGDNAFGSDSVVRIACNYLPGRAAYSNAGVDYGAFSADGSRLRFKNKDISTAEEWKAWLSELSSNGTPFTVVYKLANDIATDITATEAGQALLALKTNYPTTSVISDIDLNITYKADTKNYIDNKIAALTALTLEG